MKIKEKNLAATYNKLRWTCRRGMLELDVLLINFLDEKYQYLSQQDQHFFAELLTFSDHDLYAWLITQTVVSNKELIPLIKMIRDHAVNRF